MWNVIIECISRNFVQCIVKQKRCLYENLIALLFKKMSNIGVHVLEDNLV